MKKILLTLLFINTIFAQDVVSIVTSGDGPTKDQATTAALRNAIEQAYGTFISSNTKFLNDELIQDEIVSLSQGTITEYNIISSIATKNGYNVTTKSTVSLGKLTSFVQSKGGKTELAGALFARNIKILNFNEENQKKVLNNMYLTVKEMAKAGFYDFEIINIGEPKKVKKESEWNSRVSAWNNKYYVPFQIKISKNKNFENAMIYMGETLISIGLSEEEKAKYLDVDKYVYDLDLIRVSVKKRGKEVRYKNWVSLIGEKPTDEIWRTLKIFDEELYKFKISNGSSKDYFNLSPHSAVDPRRFSSNSYFKENYSWIAYNPFQYGLPCNGDGTLSPLCFKFDYKGNDRNGLTDIYPNPNGLRIENHPFMFVLRSNGSIIMDNVYNWNVWEDDSRYADYWIRGINYKPDYILINPPFSMTINFLNFLTLDELSNIKSYNIEPTRNLKNFEG